WGTRNETRSARLREAGCRNSQVNQLLQEYDPSARKGYWVNGVNWQYHFMRYAQSARQLVKRTADAPLEVQRTGNQQ
ncbi:hypothetical protein, partial [Luteitalea sp.]|uniref:hypothetical protein n=1 Tax=Luteitalea sp. TaxID=2004800 RepID=UPI0025BDA09B